MVVNDVSEWLWSTSLEHAYLRLGIQALQLIVECVEDVIVFHSWKNPLYLYIGKVCRN